MALLMMLSFVSCSKEKSTDDFLKSTLDKMSSLDPVEQSIKMSISDTSNNAQLTQMVMNMKSNVNSKKFYCDVSYSMPIPQSASTKLSMSIVGDNDKVFLKIPSIFPKYIDISDSKEGLEMKNSISQNSFNEKDSEYTQVLEKIFTDAIEKKSSLTTIKKTIRGTEQTLRELSASLDETAVNDLLKEYVKDMLQSNPGSSNSQGGTNDIKAATDSMAITNFKFTSDITEDFIPVYTTMSYTMKMGDSSFDVSMDLTIVNFGDEVKIPSINSDEIASPAETKKLPISFQ